MLRQHLRKSTSTATFAALLFFFAGSSIARASDLERELTLIVREFDIAKYDAANDDARVKALEAVRQHAAALEQQYPKRTEPLVWQATALAEQSSLLRSLGMLKQARQKLEAAIALDPNGRDATAYSLLGSLYVNAPGFPLSFGDKKKARVCLQKALAIDPTAASPNLNYAALLFKEDDYAGAIKYATAALNAPPRPGREKDDQNARARAEARIAKSQEKLR